MTRLIDLAARRKARALGVYWDAVTRRAPSADRHQPHGDAELVDLIHRIQTVADDARRAQPAADDPLPRRLLDIHREMNAMPASTLPRPTSSPLVRPAPAKGPHPAPWLGPVGRWGVLARLALAATVLLTLGLAGWVFAPDNRGPGRLAGIPAVVLQDGSPSPAGVTDQETLVELTLPTEALPGDRSSLLVALHTIPAGARTTWNATTVPGCCLRQEVSVVLEGTASIRAEAPIHVVRAGGGATAEEVAAGSAVTVAAGDAVIWQAAVAFEWTVTDDAPMLVMSSALGDLTSAAPVPGWREEDVQFGPTRSFPPGPYVLRMWRASLAPEAVLPTQGSLVQLSVTLAPADARTVRGSDGAVRNTGQRPVTLYTVTLERAAPDASPTVPHTTASPVVAASPVAAGRSR